MAPEKLIVTRPDVTDIVGDRVPVPIDRLPTAQLPVASVMSRLSDEDRTRLTRVLSEPIEYLKHPSFSKAKTVKDLFGKDVGGERAQNSWSNSADATAGVTEDCILKQKTLTTAQEQRLFLRLNYARYRMARLFSALAK